MGGKSGAGEVCGEIANQSPKWTQWRKTSSDSYVGNYPKESKKGAAATWGTEL
ncbi:hypothetical protein [Huintestinicola sp.]|uniref:hypothetical protein n=1 Tax=Huintestinicola sp. TaxID=2981661 RepID=UPI003D7DA53F